MVGDHNGLHHHVGKGLYYLQLQMWMRLFHRKQFYIVTSESLRESTDAHARILEWLGLPITGSMECGGVRYDGYASVGEFQDKMRNPEEEGTQEEEWAANETAGKRDITEVLTADQIADIIERYRPWNRRLHELIGMDTGYPA